MAFDKEAQRQRAAQMSAGAPAKGYEPTVKGFDSVPLKVGDTVIHTTCSGNTIRHAKRTIAEIDVVGDRVKFEDSSQWVIKVKRLIKYTAS